MPTASCFAIIPSEKSASSAKTKAGRFSLMLKALIALTVLTATLWQATGTTLAQDADPASDPTAAAVETDTETTASANDPAEEKKTLGWDLSLIHI